jgi:Na+-translocating ferredoxin:NAD+ oxidoreductase RnfC subunit
VQYADIDTNHEHITSAFLCCECGMCELFACPLEIRPRRILADLKAELVRRGVANPHVRTELAPVPVREYRQIPTSRLVARLGLSDYDRDAPFEDGPVAPERVTLRLDQHVGEPSVPVVSTGDRLLEGDVVAEAPPGGLGAMVHASITGRVVSVEARTVSVQAQEETHVGLDGGRA